MTNPQEVMRQAVDGHAKGVALRLGLHVNSVYKMLAEPEACRYSRFLQIFTAIYDENPTGAEAVFEHFRGCVAALREKSANGTMQTTDWYAAVAKTVRESAEAIEAAIEERDPLKLQKEITEAIGAFRQMQRLAVARGEDGSGSGVRSLESRRVAGGR